MPDKLHLRDQKVNWYIYKQRLRTTGFRAINPEEMIGSPEDSVAMFHFGSFTDHGAIDTGPETNAINS